MPSGAYIPPQWNTALSIATCMLIWPGQASVPQYQPSGITVTLPQGVTVYVFDAVIQIAHRRGLVKTQHPIQTGSNVSDNAYIKPAQVVLDIRMSDVMASYSAGMWVGGATKSVSAYQTLVAMQASRVPLVLTTKLETYQNMLIEEIDAIDTKSTMYGLRASVTFGELFTANVVTVPNSARPNTTNSTKLGTVSPQTPTVTQTQQHNVQTGVTQQQSVAPMSVGTISGAQPAAASVVAADVPGAGVWTSSGLSSVVSGLQNVFTNIGKAVFF